MDIGSGKELTSLKVSFASINSTQVASSGRHSTSQDSTGPRNTITDEADETHSDKCNTPKWKGIEVKAKTPAA